MKGYDHLVLRFAQHGDGYEVRCAGPGVEARGRFVLPFSEPALDGFARRMSHARSPTRHLGEGAPETLDAKEFGGRLFDALFAGQVRDVFRDSLRAARARNRGLRLTLQLSETLELANVPWEYLYDAPRFLATSEWTPVVRYLDLPRSRGAWPVKPPLRVLAMISDPSDAAALDAVAERERVTAALRPLIERGEVELAWTEPTLGALADDLASGEFHVFHYIGHGRYDELAGDGELLLKDERSRSAAVRGERLGTVLQDHLSLRLAVLNTCEGARGSRTDPFAGVAVSLVQREIPAVVAMQFEITDPAAVTFAGALYAALTAGEPIDGAVARARWDIFNEVNDIEWATPVLFLREPDGRLFDLPSRERRFPTLAPWMRWGLFSVGAFAFVGFLDVGRRLRDRELRNWGLAYACVAAILWAMSLNPAWSLGPVMVLWLTLWAISTAHALVLGPAVERRLATRTSPAEAGGWFPAYSRWIGWAMFSAGFLAFIGFFAIANRVGDRRLRYAGVGWAIASVAACVGTYKAGAGSVQGSALFTAMWLGSVGHALAESPRVERLRRRAHVVPARQAGSRRRILGLAPWMLWAILSFGLFAWVGFLTVASRFHDVRLRNWAIAWGLFAFIVVVLSATAPDAVGEVLVPLFWLASVVHTVAAGRRVERLRRRAGTVLDA